MLTESEVGCRILRFWGCKKQRNRKGYYWEQHVARGVGRFQVDSELVKIMWKNKIDQKALTFLSKFIFRNEFLAARQPVLLFRSQFSLLS